MARWRLTPSRNFEGRFAERILPSQLRILNVSFLVPSLRREYGGVPVTSPMGCGNSSEVVPLATLGGDGQDYFGSSERTGR
jgi:adenosine kinase